MEAGNNTSSHYRFKLPQVRFTILPNAEVYFIPFDITHLPFAILDGDREELFRIGRTLPAQVELSMIAG